MRKNSLLLSRGCWMMRICGDDWGNRRGRGWLTITISVVMRGGWRGFSGSSASHDNGKPSACWGQGRRLVVRNGRLVLMANGSDDRRGFLRGLTAATGLAAAAPLAQAQSGG